MYYEYFGLSEAPFKITPNPVLFYTGGNRGAILDALVYAVVSGEGIIKVVGEVGSGKTMLCRMLDGRLPDHIDILYLPNPSLSREELLDMLAVELQIDPDLADRRGGGLMRRLQETLIERHAHGRQVVVFVEEAQAMPLDTLEEIRLLSNLETSRDKLLQIVFFGQPELDESLNQRNMRQLKERITHCFHLQPFTQEEIRAYLNFRMTAAGYKGPDLFDDTMAEQIGKASEGISRRINILADKALLAAFARNTRTVTSEHIAAAIRDSHFSALPPSVTPARFRPRRIAAIAVLAGLTGAGLIALLGTARTPPPTPASPAPALATETKPEARPDAALTADPPPVAANPIPESPAGPETKGKQPPFVYKPGMPTLLAERIAATRQWVATAPEQTYSIQITLIRGKTALKDTELYLRNLAAQGEINKYYVYHRYTPNEGNVYGVLYSEYPNQTAARAAIARLPRHLKAQNPFVRTSKGVSDEFNDKK